MIARHLLNALECSLPPDDRARPWLHVVEPAPEPVVVVVPKPPPTPVRVRPAPKLARVRLGMHVLEPVHAVLVAGGAMTVRDVTLALSAKRGAPVSHHAVGKALRTLEMDKRAVAVALMSKRDIERAGGLWLWSAA